MVRGKVRWWKRRGKGGGGGGRGKRERTSISGFEMRRGWVGLEGMRRDETIEKLKLFACAWKALIH